MAQLILATAVEFDISDGVFDDGFKERAALLLDRVEAAMTRRISRGVGILATDDGLMGQHRGVRLRSRDILGVERAVEFDRGVDFFHDRVGPGLKTAAPHLVAHAHPRACR